MFMEPLYLFPHHQHSTHTPTAVKEPVAVEDIVPRGESRERRYDGFFWLQIDAYNYILLIID
jgi:hypothetical protein